jgi:hypothetical protein
MSTREKLLNPIENVESGTIDTPNTEIHDHSLSWIATSSSIKRGGVKLVLWVET